MCRREPLFWLSGVLIFLVMAGAAGGCIYLNMWLWPDLPSTAAKVALIVGEFIGLAVLFAVVTVPLRYIYAHCAPLAPTRRL